MSRDLNSGFSLKDCLFGGVKLDKINQYILVVVLDSIRVKNFYYLTVAWVKLSLSLELI